LASPDESNGLDRLRQFLDSRDRRRADGQQIPESVAERIARSLVGEPPPGLTCDEVERWLPEYLEAELRHVSVASRFPEVARHLRACRRCSALYAELLDLGLARDVAPVVLPAPVIAEERISMADLRVFAQHVTERCLEIFHVDIDALADLPTVAEVFFEQVQGLGDRFSLQAVTGKVFGFGPAEGEEPLRSLAVSWAATLKLADQLAPDGVMASRAPGQLEALAQAAATRAAADQGLKDSEADQFIATFTQMVLEPGSAFGPGQMDR
jgi:hypothetical protein